MPITSSSTVHYCTRPSALTEYPDYEWPALIGTPTSLQCLTELPRQREIRRETMSAKHETPVAAIQCGVQKRSGFCGLVTVGVFQDDAPLRIALLVPLGGQS